MRYELYGIYKKESGTNCFIGSFRSYKKATIFLEDQEYTQFEEFFILEKARKHTFPYGYTFFDRSGVAYRSGIMALQYKPAFWNNQKEYNEFMNLRKGV